MSYGKGTPRRWAIQTAIGSIVATTSEAASVLSGGVGTIAGWARMTRQSQEIRGVPMIGIQLFSAATRAAVTSWKRSAQLMSACPRHDVRFA